MTLFEILAVVVYLLLIGYLGFLGWQRTKSAADYLIAGRKAHPFIMALSYGATFISTSAIVGFGGVAGLFGMSLLWLTFLNIFVGIFIAFVFLGGPTRRMGHRLNAHTFPELLGLRFESKFIQIFAGLVIFLVMPLYASGVLIGGCKFLATKFGVEYEYALLGFSALIALYVMVGGLKGVMYTDALQGTIMFLGMLALLVVTYTSLGGINAAHQQLGAIDDLAPAQAIGHQGWTEMPKFGWGSHEYDLWYIVVTAIVLGVGIGVLAQPQLAVRFMTVKSNRELNRAVTVGGVFILIMTGVAFTVGSLSNAWFTEFGPPMKGRVVKVTEEPNHGILQLMTQDDEGVWSDVEGKMAPVVIDDVAGVIDSATIQVAGDQADANGEPMMVDQQVDIVQGRSISIVYAKGDLENIIPAYINAAFPPWFGLVFLLTLLAAAMSTLSSQFHAVGTSIGRDVYEQATGRSGASIGITRIGVFVGVVFAVIMSYIAPKQSFVQAAIARFTAIFFGLCAASFLPAFVGGLFFKGVTRAGAKASMVVGFIITAFWLLFIKQKEAAALRLCNLLTGKDSLLANQPNWPEVDPMVVALPVSLLVLILVSIFTQRPSDETLEKAFGK